MNFTRIIIQEENNAFYNMALDEAICEAVRNDLSPPTLRIYKWERPTLSLGCFQKLSDIDLDYCNSKNYPVVRRLTGGRAILHESELTYSFSAKKGSLLFNGQLHNDYTVISNALVAGLKLCGINAEISFTRKRASDQKSPACFKVVSYGEVTVDNKKVIGSAQKRYKDGFLQHGSLLLDFDEDKLQRALKHCSADDFTGIGSINEYANKVPYQYLVKNLKKAFGTVLDTMMISGDPTDKELASAKELASKKYSSAEWNAGR